MPRPEPLRALLVLRRIEAQSAKVRMMEAIAGQSRAEAALRSHDAALRREVCHAGGAAFAAWLPTAGEAADRAAAALGLATANSVEACGAAAAATLAEKATVQELRRQAGIRRAARLGREQQDLDDIAQACAAAS